MLKTLMKDFKIASYAGSAINTLSLARIAVFFTVISIFILQIVRFLFKEKKGIKF